MLYIRPTMAEAGANMVKNIQPPNPASLLERGAEDKCVGGDGGTTLTHLVETSYSRTRAGGSSPGKVRWHLNVNF